VLTAVPKNNETTAEPKSLAALCRTDTSSLGEARLVPLLPP